MNTILRRVLPRGVIVALARLLPWYNRQLDPEELGESIARNLPIGTPKSLVIDWVRERQPLFLDDLGSRVEARLLGEAKDMIHNWDIEVTFDFDAQERLLSHSKSRLLYFV